MSWNDYYRRRDIMDAVLKRAKREPGSPLPFADIDGAEELFGTEQQLLLALYYRWMQLLTGNLHSAVGGPEDIGAGPELSDADQVDAVVAAWRETAREHAALRAVLDGNIDRYPAALRPALENEQRVLALTAGLVEPFEPVEEITGVGASFLTLVRHGSTRPSGPRPAGRLLRLFSSAG